MVDKKKLNIKKIDINSLVPADYNPRKISEKDYNNLSTSINEFGIVDPIIVNLKDNTIISGHQRFDVLYYKNNLTDLYLIELGDIGWVFPDTDLKIKDKNHEKALNLALNRIHGEFDEEKVNEVLIELEELKLDHLTGFDLDFDDIDYEFITRMEDGDEYYGEESDEYYEDIEDSDELYIEEYEEEDKIEEVIEEEDSSDERIRRGFIKYGDIYQIGDSSYLMFGKYNNEQDRTKLLTINPQKTQNFPKEENLHNIKTITKEIKYYVSDDAELIENIIIKNKKICKKVK